MVKLLLSIDRRESTQAALETVKLAAEFQKQGVVGIDLSGNPTVGSWDTWEPALRDARQSGLKLTIHAAEASPISLACKNITKKVVPTWSNNAQTAPIFHFLPEKSLLLPYT